MSKSRFRNRSKWWGWDLTTRSVPLQSPRCHQPYSFKNYPPTHDLPSSSHQHREPSIFSCNRYLESSSCPQALVGMVIIRGACQKGRFSVSARVDLCAGCLQTRLWETLARDVHKWLIRTVGFFSVWICVIEVAWWEPSQQHFPAGRQVSTSWQWMCLWRGQILEGDRQHFRLARQGSLYEVLLHILGRDRVKR